jgi:hypothetical protein
VRTSVTPRPRSVGPAKSDVPAPNPNPRSSPRVQRRRVHRGSAGFSEPLEQVHRAGFRPHLSCGCCLGCLADEGDCSCGMACDS